MREHVLDRAQRPAPRKVGGRHCERVTKALTLAHPCPEHLVELEEGEGVGEKPFGQLGSALVARVGRAPGRWDGCEVSRPGRESECGADDRAATLDLYLDGRDEEARELRRPVDAK